MKEDEPNQLIHVSQWSSVGTLEDFLAGKTSPFGRNKVDLNRKLHLIQGLLEGLLAFHEFSNGFLHGAINPTNILLSQNYIPLLMNFDRRQYIPRHLAIKYNKLISQKAELPLNEVYAPPEVDTEGLYPCPPYPSSDLYSVGLISYELLAERRLGSISHYLCSLISAIVHFRAKVELRN